MAGRVHAPFVPRVPTDRIDRTVEDRDLDDLVVRAIRRDGHGAPVVAVVRDAVVGVVGAAERPRRERRPPLRSRVQGPRLDLFQALFGEIDGRRLLPTGLDRARALHEADADRSGSDRDEGGRHQHFGQREASVFANHVVTCLRGAQ